MGDIKIDFSGFNAEHCAKQTEEQFIKEQFDSVPDSYGSDDKKKAFLKEAYAKIQAAVKGENKGNGKGK